MADVHIVRVFTDEQGLFGNNLGVVLDASGLDAAAGSRLATELGFSEVVFVDDTAAARLRIFTPKEELPLAGHPLVGTAWLLGRLSGQPLQVLRPAKAAEVATWVEDGRTWIRGRIKDAPDWGMRARCFASRSGIAEDEATGSAAMRQVEALNRKLVIHQGWGSELLARPAAQAGWAEVGGRVASDGVRSVRF